MPSTDEIQRAITDKIVQALRTGSLPPWRQAWSPDPNCGAPRSVTQRPFKSINALLLNMASMERGYQSCFWGTRRQIGQMGGRICRGEKATAVVLHDPYIKPKGDEDCSYKLWYVYNVQQTEGLEHLWPGQAPIDDTEVLQRFHSADTAIEATGADIRFGGNRAYYSPTGDHVQVPFRKQFTEGEYFETVFHELSHWTEHETRLNLDRSKPENSYELLELRAELGGVFCCAQLGLPTSQRLDNHAAYLEFWIQQMQADATFILKIASLGSKATDYILSFSQGRGEEPAIII